MEIQFVKASLGWPLFTVILAALTLPVVLVALLLRLDRGQADCPTLELTVKKQALLKHRAKYGDPRERHSRPPRGRPYGSSSTHN